MGMPVRYKDDCPNGMTEEQREKWRKMEGNEAREFVLKCQEENLTDEFKAWREERIAKGMYGGAGGLFPKYSYVRDENGKRVRVENDPDDY